MSKKLPEMLEGTIQKIKEMVDVNSVMGDPITTPDGVTIIPVSRISIGFGGGGSDMSKAVSADSPFGGGAGAGVKIIPLCFLVVRDGNVRILPVAQAPNSTADRIVEMIPDTLDKIGDFLDSRTEEKKPE